MTPPPAAAKILPLDQAVRWRQSQRGPVVFTNGVFELLHRGHVEYLEAARATGAALIVGINSDDSARALAKGPGRPLVAAADRARVLAGLAAVDCVVVFDDPTPVPILQAIRPDILVKGGDYTRDTIVGAGLVEGWGGRVLALPFVPSHSTSSLLERLRATS